MQDADGPVTSYQRARVLYLAVWRPALFRLRAVVDEVRKGFDDYFNVGRG